MGAGFETSPIKRKPSSHPMDHESKEPFRDKVKRRREETQTLATKPSDGKDKLSTQLGCPFSDPRLKA